MTKTIFTQCLPNDMRIVLIGSENSKRTTYFMEAAKSCGVICEFMDYGEIDHAKLRGAVIKIDPTDEKGAFLNHIHDVGIRYIQTLEQLDAIQNAIFLNRPKSVIETLDKSVCNRKLMENHIPCTEMLAGGVQSIGEIKEIMTENRVFGVFIKPTLGSGAAGVMAYRFQPKTNKEALYTSAAFVNGVLCNTKKVCLITNPSEVKLKVDELLKSPVIVEKWIPKDVWNGYAYDIRVVYQFGKVEYMVARLSKSPITNLHLNNGAMDIEKIGLPGSCLNDIAALCKEACSLFQGLNYAGIDVLLSKINRKPQIIEINGQGDLIYKDIYNENRIYTNQIKGMMNLWNCRKDYRRNGSQIQRIKGMQST